MGSAYFIATEREVARYDADSIEGKILAKADLQLDETGFYEQRQPFCPWSCRLRMDGREASPQWTDPAE